MEALCQLSYSPENHKWYQRLIRSKQEFNKVSNNKCGSAHVARPSSLASC